MACQKNNRQQKPSVPEIFPKKGMGVFLRMGLTAWIRGGWYDVGVGLNLLDWGGVLFVFAFVIYIESTCVRALSR